VDADFAMRRYIRLYLAFARNCFVRELEYRVSFALRALGSVAEGALPILFLTFVFRQVRAVAGWSGDQMLLLMGTYTLVEGTLSTLFGSNMRQISQYVNRGELDLILTKPVSSQFYVSTRLLEWESCPRIALGAAISAYAFRKLGLSLTWETAAVYLAALCAGLAIGYSIWLISVVWVFWTERLGNAGFAFYTFLELGRLPVQAFRGLVRMFLTFGLPLAFMTTVPTEALLGLLTPARGLQSLGLAALFLAASSWAWRIGLRSYASASS
jgi:ABC-2 type transport system permease protein